MRERERERERKDRREQGTIGHQKLVEGLRKYCTEYDEKVAASGEDCCAALPKPGSRQQRRKAVGRLLHFLHEKEEEDEKERERSVEKGTTKLEFPFSEFAERKNVLR